MHRYWISKVLLRCMHFILRFTTFSHIPVLQYIVYKMVNTKLWSGGGCCTVLANHHFSHGSALLSYTHCMSSQWKLSLDYNEINAEVIVIFRLYQYMSILFPPQIWSLCSTVSSALSVNKICILFQTTMTNVKPNSNNPVSGKIITFIRPACSLQNVV